MTGAVVAACLGGVLSLDGRVIGRTLLGEPLYAAMLTGACLNHFPEGMVIGCFLQLVWLNLLPEGAVVLPDGAVPAIVATALGVQLESLLPLHPRALWVFLLAVTLPLGLASRWADTRLREWHGRLGHWVDMAAHHGNASGVGRVMWLATLATMAKGALLCSVPVVIGGVVLPKVVVTLPHQVLNGMDIAYFLLLPLGFSVALELLVAGAHSMWWMFLICFGLASGAWMWGGWPRPWMWMVGVVVCTGAVQIKRLPWWKP